MARSSYVRKEPPADTTPVQDVQPNGSKLNRGGNWGNAYRAGPHKRSFRAKAAKAADEGLDFWIAVSRGNKVIPVPGGAKDFRNPTLKERKEAYVEILLRFGIGTQDEVTVLGNAETYRAVADAMKIEGHEEQAIVAVLVRLRETFRDDAG